MRWLKIFSSECDTWQSMPMIANDCHLLDRPSAYQADRHSQSNTSDQPAAKGLACGIRDKPRLVRLIIALSRSLAWPSRSSPSSPSPQPRFTPPSAELCCALTFCITRCTLPRVSQAALGAVSHAARLKNQCETITGRVFGVIHQTPCPPRQRGTNSHPTS